MTDLPSHYTYLPNFYASHFPSHLIFNLFTITPQREFSFQLSNQKIIRHKSFDTTFLLDNFLSLNVPLKIDLGCEIVNEENREFVIDIDLSDYFKENVSVKKFKSQSQSDKDSEDLFVRKEDVHFCGKLCSSCLSSINHLIKTLNNILRDSLGLKNIIFFFSGGKGFHCYIFPDYSLSNYLRESLVLYLLRFGILADVGVSRDVKHLLKCPFVVHPKTGYVCLPVVISSESEGVELVHVKEVVEGTVSMKKYVEYVERFVTALNEKKRDSS